MSTSSSPALDRARMVLNVQTSGNLLYTNDNNNNHDDETLPTYTEQDETTETTLEVLAAAAASCDDGRELPITDGSEPEAGHWDETAKARFQIVLTFFQAIRTKRDELVAMLIDRGLVTADTLDRYGSTPLLMAVVAGDVRMVQELVDFGAQIDRFGAEVYLSIYLSICPSIHPSCLVWLVF
jgi:hypothetical protein